MLAREREVGDNREGERSSDQARLPAAIPRTHHYGHTKQSEAAFGNVGQQNRGNQRQRSAEIVTPRRLVVESRGGRRVVAILNGAFVVRFHGLAGDRMDAGAGGR